MVVTCSNMFALLLIAKATGRTQGISRLRAHAPTLGESPIASHPRHDVIVYVDFQGN